MDAMLGSALKPVIATEDANGKNVPVREEI